MANTISSQLAQTKQLFRAYLFDYTFPISYEEWYQADEDSKAALLFVNFYKEIALAWSKWTAPYFSQEDGVSIAMQYITKQVDKLMVNPKLFTPQYFYAVLWNAFGGYVRSRVTDKLRCDSEMSCFVEETDGLGQSTVVNIIDLFPSHDDDYEVAQAKEAIWTIIESLGPKAEKVVNHLINPKDSLRRTSKKDISWEKDRLRDVFVSSEEYPIIIEQLESALEPYLDYFI